MQVKIMVTGCCRDDVPIVIVMKAMGIESDQEVTQLIGSEGAYTALFAPSLQECKQHAVFSQHQALEWLGQLLFQLLPLHVCLCLHPLSVCACMHVLLGAHGCVCSPGRLMHWCDDCSLCIW